MPVHDRRIDRRVLDGARTLIARGWDVTVIAGPADPTHPAPDEEVYPDVPIVRVQAGAAPPAAAAVPPELAPARNVPWSRFSPYHDEFVAAALARPVQVYVAHDLPQLAPAVFAARRYGSYVVYDSHELFPEQRHLFAQGIAWFLVALERWLLCYVDRVITVNASIAEYMSVRYDIPVPDIVINAPHAASEPERTQLLREELGIPAERTVLLFHGGYALTRNLETLAEAMLHVRSDAALVLMGPGFDGSPAASLAQELGLLGERVFFRRAVGQDALLRYAASADVGIIPYSPRDELAVYWCTPNKLFEFIVAGLPILATDLPELRRYVGGQKIGLNRSMATPQATAAAIDEIIAGDLEGMRKRVREVRSAFTWDAQADRVAAIFAEVLEQPPRAVGPPPPAARERADAITVGFPRQLATGGLDLVPRAELVHALGYRIAAKLLRGFDSAIATIGGAS